MSQPSNPQLPLPVPRAPQTMPEFVPAPTAVLTNGYALASPARPAAPSALTAAPNASTLLHAFRRRWPLAVAVGLAGAVVAVIAVAQVVPGQYTAEALIKVAPPHQDENAGEANLDYRSFRDNQQAILTSTPVLSAALTRPGVKELPRIQGMLNPTGYLRSHIKSDFNSGPLMMRVTMSGDDPEELKVLVNAVAEAFVAEAEREDKQKREGIEAEIKKQHRDTKKAIRDKTLRLNELRIHRNVLSPDETKARIDQVRRAQDANEKQINDLAAKEIDAQSQLSGLREQLNNLNGKPVPDQVVDKYLQGDKELQTIKELIAVQDLKIKETFENARDPQFKKEQAAPYFYQKEKLLEDLKLYRKLKQSHVREQWRIDLEDKKGTLDQELAAIELKKNLVQQHSEDLNKKLKTLLGRRVFEEEQSLESDILMDENTLKLMETKLATLKVSPLTTSITLQQRADAPQTLDRGRQLKFAGAAGLGAFIFLLLGVTLMEFRSRKINTAAEVVDGLGLELLGALPALPPRARNGSATPGKRELYWQSVMTESIDSIRTMLLHAARHERLQVVMVTSAVGGEGKTSLASQLAASLARAWKKTLLVDGDLRNPAAHQLFAQPLEPGLSEVLRGEVHLDDVVRPTPLSRLWVLPAGQWDSHAVQALAQDGVRTMFDRLKEQYDFIIVDSCPVLPVADSLSLGQHVDAVLFAILRDISRAPSVYAAQQRLTGLGVRILGAVLIGENGGAGSSYQYPTRKGS
jgi:capsular exopolysaccharide synthesis family protein